MSEASAGIMLTTVEYQERMKNEKAIKIDRTLYIGVWGRQTALRHFSELATTVRKQRWTRGYRSARVYEPYVSSAGMVCSCAEDGKLNLFYDGQSREIPEVGT
jgi:hypothetical protein